MSGNPILSVLVLTYNQESTIKQTLDSILSQEHDYSYEVIVGDDASSDGTSEIVKEYAKKYPKIVKPIIREQNLGLIKNYYDLVDRARGEFIMGCAGDDYWLPGKVETQMKYMISHPECFLSYSHASIYDPTKKREMSFFYGSNNNSLSKLLIANHVPAVTIAYRKCLIETLSVLCGEKIITWEMEDYPLVLLASGLKGLHLIPVNTAVYRLSKNSISRSPDTLKQIDFLTSTFDIQMFFSNIFNASRKQISEMKCLQWLSLTKIAPNWKQIGGSCDNFTLSFSDLALASPKISLKIMYKSIRSWIRNLFRL